jgi:hypothetical protein
VSPPDRRGFGSTVIASMAKLSVGGEVQLDYARAGLTWRLTCPATNALERSADEHESGDSREAGHSLIISPSGQDCDG